MYVLHVRLHAYERFANLAHEQTGTGHAFRVRVAPARAKPRADTAVAGPRRPPGAMARADAAAVGICMALLVGSACAADPGNASCCADAAVSGRQPVDGPWRLLEPAVYERMDRAQLDEYVAGLYPGIKHASYNADEDAVAHSALAWAHRLYGPAPLWLPVPISWRLVRAFGYPALDDLWPCLPITVGLVVLRRLVDRLVTRPLGRRWGLRATQPHRARRIPLLVQAYARSRHPTSHEVRRARFACFRSRPDPLTARVGCSSMRWPNRCRGRAARSSNGTVSAATRENRVTCRSSARPGTGAAASMPDAPGAA